MAKKRKRSSSSNCKCVRVTQKRCRNAKGQLKRSCRKGRK